jgi:molybdopterin converting factor small subunit
VAKVTVKLHGVLKDSAGTGRVDMEGESIPAILKALGESHGERFRAVLFDEHGKVRSGHQLLLGTAYLDPRKLESVKLSDGDMLHVMPPIAGG